MNIKIVAFCLILLSLCLGITQAQDLTNVKHYTTENGLPHNVVFNILQDSKGYIWIGTDDGLVRFDGNTFKTYRSSNGLLSNYVITMAEAKDGTLWIGSWKGGVNCLRNDSIFTPSIDYPLFRVASLYINDDQLVLSDNRYFVYPYTKSQGQWLHDHKKINKTLRLKKGSHIKFYNPPDVKGRKDLIFLTNIKTYLSQDKSTFIFGGFAGVWKKQTNDSFTPLYPHIIKQDSIYHVSQDAQKRYWFGSRGKIIIADSTGQLSSVIKGLPNSEIYDIRVTSTGKIYFMTGIFELKDKGAYSYDPATGKIVNLKKALALRSLPSYMEIDNEDNLWLSTHGDGVYCIPLSAFRNYTKQNGIPKMPIQDIKQDEHGNIYAGTLNGLFLYENGRFSYQKLFKNNTSYKITSLFSDKKNKLLLNVITQTKKRESSYLFEIDDKKNRKITKQHYQYAPYIDSQNTLWGFAFQGIYSRPYESKPLPENEQWHYLQKEILVTQGFEYKGKHWIATNKGLFSYKRKRIPEKNNFLQFLDTLTIKNGLSSNYINSVEKGQKGELWIGTKEGLCRLKNGKIDSFSTKDGLASNNCTSLLFDHHGFLWVGTSKGLCHFDGKRFITHNRKTGLISSNINCLFLDNKKRLWIGTSWGISMIDISKPPANISPPDIYIEATEANGLPMPPGNNLELNYKSSLKVFFRALTYIYPDGIRYQYRLNKGKWQNTRLNFAEYNTFLNGIYTFEVRAKKFNSGWSVIKQLIIKVKTPFWMTWGAIGLYIVFSVLVVYVIVRWRSEKLEKEKAKLEQLVTKRTYELQQQKEEIASQAEQLKEVDKIKSNFFSNISHEFRTPLTLITGPAEKLLDLGKGTPSEPYSRSILTNAQRLLKLINQLLDFSKLENGKMIIQPKVEKLDVFLQNMLHSFELLARQKNIQLEFIHNQQEIMYEFDQDKLEKVFFNLLSNAFKFTPVNGSVSLTLSQSQHFINVSVADTGIGISSQSLPFIFDRFYQADGSQTRTHEGTGIGLSLVKELIELHQGSIEVSSKPGKGTTFSIKLPLHPYYQSIEAKNQVDINLNLSDKQVPAIPKNTLMSTSNQATDPSVKNTILVVEDNEELRQFICTELTAVHNIAEATNGEEGIAKAQEIMPDLIITDVMMPKADGFELIKTLRENAGTSHIPIIILSAKTSYESRITGLETGSDDYLTKPFSPKELLLKIRNMFARQEKLREKFKQSMAKPEMIIEPSQVTATSMDEAFLAKAIKVVEINLTNSAFSVPAFCKEIGMSQSGLFKKLKALTNLSTTEFIRSIKLKRAASLIKQQSGRIEEIAFDVGFNDVSYFNRCFKKQFGVTPKEYQTNQVKI